MIVIVTNNAPPRLRGRLAVWMIEIRAGVYVGSFSAKTRDILWQQVEEGIGDGDAVLAWPTRTDQGFSFKTCGQNRRVPTDINGLVLVRIPSEDSKERQQPSTST